MIFAVHVVHVVHAIALQYWLCLHAAHGMIVLGVHAMHDIIVSGGGRRLYMSTCDKILMMVMV